MTDRLPTIIEEILNADKTPDDVFSALLPALVQLLECDRCFLYLRHPPTKIGKKAYCWRRSPEFPDVTDSDWLPEPESLMVEDPLWAAAIRTEPSVFVEDVETADPKVVNKYFERENFGHRALIHAHLCFENQMWGILQPCVFGSPRVWSQSDRSIINALTEKIAPLAVAYVQAARK